MLLNIQGLPQTGQMQKLLSEILKYIKLGLHCHKCLPLSFIRQKTFHNETIGIRHMSTILTKLNTYNLFCFKVIKYQLHTYVAGTGCLVITPFSLIISTGTWIGFGMGIGIPLRTGTKNGFFTGYGTLKGTNFGIGTGKGFFTK